MNKQTLKWTNTKHRSARARARARALACGITPYVHYYSLLLFQSLLPVGPNWASIFSTCFSMTASSCSPAYNTQGSRLPDDKKHKWGKAWHQGKENVLLQFCCSHCQCEYVRGRSASAQLSTLQSDLCVVSSLLSCWSRFYCPINAQHIILTLIAQQGKRLIRSCKVEGEWVSDSKKRSASLYLWQTKWVVSAMEVAVLFDIVWVALLFASGKESKILRKHWGKVRLLTSESLSVATVRLCESVGREQHDGLAIVYIIIVKNDQ